MTWIKPRSLVLHRLPIRFQRYAAVTLRSSLRIRRRRWPHCLRIRACALCRPRPSSNMKESSCADARRPLPPPLARQVVRDATEHGQAGEDLDEERVVEPILARARVVDGAEE